MSDEPTPGSGPADATLFEAFPEPLLVYTTEADLTRQAGDTGSVAEELVVSAINPAFASAFDMDAATVTGRSLAEVELTGTVDSEADPDGPVEQSRKGDSAERDGVQEPGDGSETSSDISSTGPATGATLRSILDTVFAAGKPVYFDHESEGETGHFRVQALGASSSIEDCYLLFTDLTELESRRRALARTVDELERLTSVASHDLRNPLEVAKIRVEAARDTGDDVHFEKATGALNRIERIVRDVLAAGGGTVEPTDRVDLEILAEAAWDTVDTAGASLVLAPDLPTILADADHLQQLFENLFRNAVEHGTPGPTSTDGSATGEPSALTITVAPIPGGFVVADDGPGVPAEAQGCVFDAGFSTDSDHSGLGLSIVSRIAREHGWQVSLVSSRESGVVADGAQFAFTGVEYVETEGGEQ